MSEADMIIESLKNSGRKVEEFYTGNKGSDKNVGSIEDDVKRCNELIKVEHANWIGISNQLAISHILAEREQKDKRIKELEEESRKKSIVLICYQEKLENSIPTQVVIDVLQNNRNELFSMTYLSKEQYRPYEMQVERINKIEQELLEGGK